MTLQIEIITTAHRFQDIEADWHRLWSRAGGDIFRSHGWLSAWLAGCEPSVTPHVAVAWHDDDLVAAIPLALRRRNGLRFLEWCAQEFNDYCDALVLPETAAELPEIWGAVWQVGGFDLLHLRQVRPDAAIRRCLDSVPGGRPSPTGDSRNTRAVAIDCVCANGDAWFRSLGKKGRNNVWRGERLLAELGGEVAYRCLDPALQPIDAEMKRLFELKQDWARLRKRHSMLLRTEGRALDAMLQAAAATGRMRLFVLTSGGTMAAASVNFLLDDTLQAYMTGYDPAFERASPGMLLIVHYVRWAYDRGLAKVDLLRGNEPFKLRLATSEIWLNRYDGARTLFGHAAHALRHGSWQLRQLVRPDGKTAGLRPAPPGVAVLGE